MLNHKFTRDIIFIGREEFSSRIFFSKCREKDGFFGMAKQEKSGEAAENKYPDIIKVISGYLCLFFLFFKDIFTDDIPWDM